MKQMSLKSERKKKVKAEKRAAAQATRADFDELWGVGEIRLPDGTPEVDEVQDLDDGTQLTKVRLIPVLIDVLKSYPESLDRGWLEDGNFAMVSNVFLTWASNQPESYIPGVAELLKHKLSQHRTGIKSGIGSPIHRHATNAVARVLASISPEEIETAKAATQRLVDKLVQTFPNATINNPPEPAATPEEKIDFYKNNESASAGELRI